MKKLLTAFIVLLLLVGCCLIAAFPTSASDINYDDWDIVDGVIVEYVGAGGDVVVPSVDADGNPVTHIDSRAFRSNTDITSVVISEGIETMGAEVFEYCENLTEATLPYSLTETGISIFRKTSLFSLTIPSNLKTVNCDFVVAAQTLSEVVISSGVERIKTGALYGTFTELVLPESVWRADAIFRGGFGKDVKRWDLYVLNPDCELGVVDPKLAGRTMEMFESGNALKTQLISETVCPITFGYQGCTCEIVIYGLKDSAIKEYVNTYMKDKMDTVIARFSGIDQAKIDELEQLNKQKSIQAPVKEPTGDNGTGDNGTGANNNNSNNGGNADNNNVENNNNNNVNGNAVQNQGSDNTLLIVLVISGVVVILAICAVVCVVVLNSGKKKKKKKKKETAPAVETVIEEIKTEE